jgi:hypothetical protein
MAARKGLENSLEKGLRIIFATISQSRPKRAVAPRGKPDLPRVGGEPESEQSSIETALRLYNKRRWVKERDSWFLSEQGRKDAELEVKRLFNELLGFARQIRDDPRRGKDDNVITVESDGKEQCVLRFYDFSLSASWNPGRFVNNLKGTGLRMTVRHTPMLTEETEEIRSTRYDIDRAEDGKVGWRETEGNKQILPSHQIAEIWIGYLMAAVPEQ